MTQEQCISPLIAIAIPVILVVVIAITYEITSRAAHKQNLKDLDERHIMPKK